MASSVSFSPHSLTLLQFSHTKSQIKFLPINQLPHLLIHKNTINSRTPPKVEIFNHLGHFSISCFSTKSSSDGSFDLVQEDELVLPASKTGPVKTLFLVLLWASVFVGFYVASGDANAAADSIRASSFGLRFAEALRGFGWPDEAVVFALATLPVIELRGAIPVGYWLQLKPVVLTVLSVLGNMVPVPFIVLYLKKFATFLAGRNQSASQFLDMLFKRAKEKAGPVEEFQWLGLMLFVAVPFPGTGAWTGAIIASVLDMPFWSAVSANFFGVVLAGLLVNLLVNLGLKYAVLTGIALFIISTFMWSILRQLKRSLSSSN
ncbi:hypothetical protein DCAR_0727729 [Daucus carota subsp. sativus]|uniref:Small multi-drug export n=1 Tax=Daucus carota subsp. sativus TaxID=79200 RepID=A0AAF0XHI2_DAUCS|nr:PREDICTED: uncharacterized protein LOC108195217 [Daucus carota subsp. sativus]WOH08291.1 hypothetical protein DCAR_0727729 [Daucus carota subsp. sativus]